MSQTTRTVKRKRLHQRIRRKITGTSARPRLSVNFSGQHINAQVIDDEKGVTLLSVCTTEKALKGEKLRPNVAGAERIGKLVAERAKAHNISRLVFDRGGFTYHGKVKALADAARDGGVEF